MGTVILATMEWPEAFATAVFFVTGSWVVVTLLKRL